MPKYESDALEVMIPIEALKISAIGGENPGLKPSFTLSPKRRLTNDLARGKNNIVN